ncbi:hypothetical protein DL240_18110 [Lujinxingia litoralis]|uniref:Uncharacterized protein n=1 Tax=Lujinxingia litoralis TaxID=2211119 RepID=A0A328C6Z7_9DELT|nr:tetratricopeptide repeat protein [Lujinxingia litoralis]RAL20294.1 hypothetical protein DL240_18110 [Lujinxingia litoralis]
MHLTPSKIHRHLVLWTAIVALGLIFTGTASAGDTPDDTSSSTPACAEDEIFDSVLGDCRYTFSIRYTSLYTLPAMIEACEQRESMIACAAWSVWAWRRGSREAVSERAGQLCEARCDAGDPAGCACLAHLVGTGSAGFEPDHRRGRSLARQSCAGGVGWGCNISRTLLHDTGNSDEERLADDGLDTYERGCELGDPSSCANLGYFDGRRSQGGELLTKRTARTYFLEGCEKHIGWACGAYGELLYLGQGGDIELEEGIAFNRRGCELGDPMSCERLGDLYLDSIDSQAPDYRLAFEYFGYACNSRDARACYMWATIADVEFPELETPKRLEQAYNIACVRGLSEGCVALSDLYLSERPDWPAQPEAARDTLERSCRQHADDSCVFYGQLLESGIGGNIDPNAALEAYDRACQNNEPKGCQWAGALLMQTEPERAREILKEGCDREQGNSCNWLALWLESNVSAENVQLNMSGLHRRACELDEPRGCIDLAFMYESGRGEFASDSRRAVTYMGKACSLRDMIACAYLGRYLRDNIGGPTPWDDHTAPFLTQLCTNAPPHLPDVRRAATLSCRWLAEGYADHNNPSSAVEFAKRGCDLRDPDSCTLAAELLRAETSESGTQNNAALYEAKACDYGGIAYCSDAANTAP